MKAQIGSPRWVHESGWWPVFVHAYQKHCRYMVQTFTEITESLFVAVKSTVTILFLAVFLLPPLWPIVVYLERFYARQLCDQEDARLEKQKQRRRDLKLDPDKNLL